VLPFAQIPEGPCIVYNGPRRLKEVRRNTPHRRQRKNYNLQLTEDVLIVEFPRCDARADAAEAAAIEPDTRFGLSRTGASPPAVARGPRRREHSI
jgi:hypothetical protein